jgi:hypothetical protein
VEGAVGNPETVTAGAAADDCQEIPEPMMKMGTMHKLMLNTIFILVGTKNGLSYSTFGASLR